MKIEILEIFGFVSAIKALRLPFKGKDKSDSITKATIECNTGAIDTLGSGYNSVRYFGSAMIGPADLRLVKRLIMNGDEHAKVIRGIIVSCSIIAPRYWWQEMDTYRIGTERLSSESTMHTDAKGLSGVKLQEIKAELKEGYNQERIQIFSYQTLRRIYIQRKKHRLPEWNLFIEWIKTLPLSKDFIYIGVNHENT